MDGVKPHKKLPIVALAMVPMATIAIVLTSCRPLAIEPGVPQIRRPNWWNFYQRGVALSLKAEWRRAADDFETAVGYRDGAIYSESTEKRRVKTYGLHFLNDYFPHRELGVCYHHLGMYRDAERELERSLEMLPTSRARSWLTRNRKAQLSQLPDPDPDSIQLVIDSIRDGLYTNRRFLQCAGTVASPYYISRLVINNHPLLLEQAVMRYDLDHRLRLEPGVQRVLVEVEDLLGNRTSWDAEVTVDMTGPAVSVATIPGDSEHVRISVDDKHGLATVEIGGKLVTVRTGDTLVSRTLGLSGTGEIHVVAVDRAGNRTEFKRATKDLRKASLRSLRMNPDRRRAALPAGSTSRGSASRPGALLQLSDARSVAVPIAKREPDTMPPRLRLFPAIDGRRVVTAEFYILDLMLTDSGSLGDITFHVNDLSESRKFDSDALIEYRFTQIIELQPGANTVRIVATDRAGNRTEKQLVLERKMDFLWREDLRVTAQVTPPDVTSVPALKTVDIYSLMLNGLLERPRRLNLVERDPETLQRLLLELKLAGSSIADQVRAIRTGKLKAADWLIQQYAGRWSGKDNWDLVLNGVDVATGEILFTVDMHFDSFNGAHIRSRLGGLVDKLAQRLPTLSAPVQSSTSRSAVVSLGRKENIFEGLLFVFIPPESEDVRFADPLSVDGAWVQARVTRVLDDTCAVEIFPRKAHAEVTPGHIAVIR